MRVPRILILSLLPWFNKYLVIFAVFLSFSYAYLALSQERCNFWIPLAALPLGNPLRNLAGGFLEGGYSGVFEEFYREVYVSGRLLLPASYGLLECLEGVAERVVQLAPFYAAIMLVALLRHYQPSEAGQLQGVVGSRLSLVLPLFVNTLVASLLLSIPSALMVSLMTSAYGPVAINFLLSLALHTVVVLFVASLSMLAFAATYSLIAVFLAAFLWLISLSLEEVAKFYSRPIYDSILASISGAEVEALPLLGMALAIVVMVLAAGAIIERRDLA